MVWHASGVARGERWAASRVRGATVWLTGLSGSGKSTIAGLVEQQLVDAGVLTYTLDGDNLRHGLNGNLGFSADDRAENVRRVGEVARLFADAGVIALVPLISPYRAGREHARALHDAAGLTFLEVFVDTPLAECEARDPKGLYKQARAGSIAEFTGISAPYEAPEKAEITLHTDREDVVGSSARVLAYLVQQGIIPKA